MHTKGIPVSRWIDGVLEDKTNIAQNDNLRAMIFWGHAPNSQTRGPEMKKAMEKLDTLIVVDPYPTVSAVMHDRTDGVYLLPAATQFETYGSVTASNRSLQFGNAKARTVVWTFPDPVPVHREPLYTGRRDLVEKYPTYEDRKSFYRLPTRYASIQAKDYSKEFPIILTSGRLVEYEGGGDESRSNAWLAELQQHMFAEIHPRDANDAGIRDGDANWAKEQHDLWYRCMEHSLAESDQDESLKKCDAFGGEEAGPK